MTEECETSSNGLFSHILCILTYGGSVVDIWINYAILLLNVAGCACWIHFISRRSSFWFPPCLSFSFVVLFQVSLCLVLKCSGISIVWCSCIGWYLHKTQCNEKRHVVPNEESSHAPCSENRPVDNDDEHGNDGGGNDPDNDDVQENSPQSEEETLQLLQEDPPSLGNSLMETIQHSQSRVELGIGALNGAALLYYAGTAPAITTAAHVCAILLGMLLSLGEGCCIDRCTICSRPTRQTSGS